MKVGQVPNVGSVYNKQGISKVEKAKELQGKKDVVAISGAGQDYNTVMKALKDVPDVREERVEELKNQVESGNYNVDSKEIADKFIKGFFDKKA